MYSTRGSRRANWVHGHTRSALDPSIKLQGYPNTYSAIGEFHRQDLDRHALDPLHRPFRDHSRRREYPSETRLCPDVPVHSNHGYRTTKRRAGCPLKGSLYKSRSSRTSSMN